MQIVALGSDHGGFRLKEALKGHVAARGFQVLDVGTFSTESCDYPVFARAAAEAVASGRAWRGIVVDGAGIGSSMVANKVPGVRAGMAFDTKTANNAREHNDANVLTLGAGYLQESDARAIVDVFLTVPCTVDRHRKRVAMIDALDAAPGRPPAPSTPGSPHACPCQASPHGDAPAPHACTCSVPKDSAPPMASSAPVHSHQALVETIVQVLKSQPTLLQSAAIAAGAPGNVCTTCNPCNGHCATEGPAAIRGMLGPSCSTDARISTGLGVGDVPPDIAGMIDHTLLKPEATYAQIDRLCLEAKTCGFKSVCVNTAYVKRAAQALRGARPVVCTVIGFPLGATPTPIKVLEARQALRDGARELDMVIHVGALKSGDLKRVYEDIRAVVEVAREGRAICKVIIETALLTDEEKVQACVLSKRARAHFVKTSTGFAKGGATEPDVALMARAVDYKLEVKASGGVRNADDAHRMVAAGATRIGASVGLKIAGCFVPGESAPTSAY